MSTMLSSWKEIAQFFGKGVRTVQRWEKTLALPIHRPPGAPSNVVLARTSDLEAWMHRSSPPGSGAEQSVTEELGELQSVVEELEAELKRLQTSFVQDSKSSNLDSSQEEQSNNSTLRGRLSRAAMRMRGLGRIATKDPREVAFPSQDSSLSTLVEGLAWPALLLDATLRPVLSNTAMRGAFGREWISALETQPFPGPMDAELGRQLTKSLERDSPSIYRNEKSKTGAPPQRFDLHINPIAMEDNTIGLLLLYAPQKAKVRSQIAA